MAAKSRYDGARFEILVILAVSLVDGGSCSPTAPGSRRDGSDSAGQRDNGLAERRDVRPTSAAAGAPRLFIDSDMIMQFAMHNIENLPKPLQGPAMFAMGFSQQNMKNFMATVRSLGQMLVSSLVMMAVKRLFFADLKTEADRNTASGLTDAILDIINLLNF